MMKWVARFSFTFLIISGWLFYQVYKMATTPGQQVPTWQYAIMLIGGTLAISLGARGIRERHKPQGGWAPVCSRICTICSTSGRIVANCGWAITR
jgi:hypothetical protein